ncbi:MAG: sugar transferase [bacterium]|nr:sugar transferase [bacterium]
MEDTEFKKYEHYWLKFGIDALLVSAAFVLTYYIKNGNLRLEYIYLEFIPIYIFCWIVSTILSGKFRLRWQKVSTKLDPDVISKIKNYLTSTLFFGALMSIFLYGEKWNQLSRLMVFGSLIMYFLLEIIILSGILLGKYKRKDHQLNTEFSFVFFLMEFLLIAVCVLYLRFHFKSIVNLSDENMLHLCGVYFIWMFIGVMVHKFQVPGDKNYLRAIWPFVKSIFFIACIITSLIFALRKQEFTKLIASWLTLLATLEFTVVSAYYLAKKKIETDTSELTLIHPQLPEKQAVKEVIEKKRTESKEFNIPRTDFQSRFVRVKLKDRYLKHHPGVFAFIDHVIDLATIDILNAEVMDTSSTYNIEIIEENALELFVNLRKINDFGNIDQYLIEVNRTLKEDGFFISNFTPSEYRHLHIRQKYPLFLGSFVYALDFIWRQVFPKIPVLRTTYFALSRGKNRVISMAECFGRLYFCGFEIISLEEVDNHLYFIAKKAKDPYTWFKYFHTFRRLPSYGLFFKQKRIGKDGKYIYMYKLQTMHPYSEFIHKYIMELNNLDESGKIKNDFRITPWGKIFRKLWIDELPMLFNLLKGDIKLFGVRPLSETFYNTYPEELQKLRVKSKPGLVPPYYADLPKNMQEVFESETRYMEKYLKNPLRTDFIYFCKAFKNIVFKGAKSG